jgi:DNA-binding MarR family transcriptional regulator
MTEKRLPGELTPSICEAAFEEYTQLDDSLAKLIKKNCLDVRDFIILSFVGDQGNLSAEQIAKILGLSLERTGFCIERLIEANLIRFEDGVKDADGEHQIRLTATGRLVTSRVHGRQE